MAGKSRRSYYVPILNEERTGSVDMILVMAATDEDALVLAARERPGEAIGQPMTPEMARRWHTKHWERLSGNARKYGRRRR